MKSAQKSLAGLLLSSFLVVALWGVTLGMNHDGMVGMTTPCPIMADYDVACAMGFGEHATFWKQLFSATVAQVGLILVMVMGFSIFSRNDQRQFYEFLMVHSSWIPPTLTRQRQQIAQLSNPIFQACSAGILEPKIH